MSKQPHDQDENQTPSGDTPPSSTSSGDGTAPSTSSDAAPSASANGGSRSRRRRRGQAAAAKPSDADANLSSGTTSIEQVADAATPPPHDDAVSVGPETVTPATDATSGTTPSITGGSTSERISDSASDSTSDDDRQPPSQDAGHEDAGHRDADSSHPGTGGRGPGTVTASGDGGGNGGRTGLIALVLAVVLGIALLLAAWQGWQRLDAQQQRLAELESRSEASASRDDMSALEARLDQGERERDSALDAALSELRSEFERYRGEVDETLDRVLDELSSEQDADEREWLHAEAAYLLRLANQRLQLERDVEGAAALLRTADARLRDADNPALTAVRRSISSELAELDAVPRVDRTGLYLALDAQQEQLASLPLGQDIEQIAAESSIEQPPSGTWQQQLSRFGSELRALVTVRHHDEALEALITPEQETYLRQNVRLLIEQAQLALLKEEEALYEASLDKALVLIERYYDTERGGVRRVIERLSELREAAISPELPDISASQQALAEFIERRFNGGGDDTQNGATDGSGGDEA